MGYDVNIHLLESACAVIAGSAETHYVQFEGIGSRLFYPLGKLLPFAVGVAGYGCDYRNRADLLGFPYEIQIVGEHLLAHIFRDIVISLRMNIRVIGGYFHSDAFLEERLEHKRSGPRLFVFGQSGD